MAAIDDIIATFQSVEAPLRLELLLDYARRLPALPPALEAEADLDERRVPECMTPVWLWVREEDGRVQIHAKVAEEAPTVQGFLSILIHGYTDATPGALAALPPDLPNRLGIANVIRMNRAVGLSAIVRRVAREGERLAQQHVS
jgi:cysteine desulfuration protein SufE